MSNPLKKLASQTVIYGLGNVLPRFISYLFTFILTYIFKEPAALAPNAVFFGYISFMNIIFTYGMETAFFNFVNKSEEKAKVYSTALISLLASTASLSLLLMLFSGSIADLIKEPGHGNFVIWCVLIIATDAITAIPFARLRLTNSARRFAVIKFLNMVVNLLGNVFYFIICKRAFEHGDDSFFAHLYNPEVGIGYAFLAQLIANLVSIALLSKEFRGFEYVFDKELWKKMFFYALPLLVLGLAGMINETFDRIILKYLLPDDIADNDVGVYSNCYKIAMLMAIFTQAFKYAAEPFFFNNAKDKNSQKLTAVVMKYYILFCLFLFLGTMMNLPWLQGAISQKYRAGLAVVPILLMANLCVGVYWNLSIWYKLTGQTRFGAYITVFGALITLIINFMFIPTYSYMACAWATFFSYSSMMIVSYVLGQKYYPIKYNLRSIFVFTALALGFYFISLLYNGMESIILKLILNNALLFLFGWIFYKLEFDNLKKLKHLEG
ncbi:MAG: oligosaccharide flippase family protein [Bacteroidota bacterium]